MYGRVGVINELFTDIINIMETKENHEGCKKRLEARVKRISEKIEKFFEDAHK
jgi:hypothetical protein